MLIDVECLRVLFIVAMISLDLTQPSPRFHAISVPAVKKFSGNRQEKREFETGVLSRTV